MRSDVVRRIREVKTDRWIWPVKNLTRGKMTHYAHHGEREEKREGERERLVSF